MARSAQAAMRLSRMLQRAFSNLRQSGPFALPTALFVLIYNQVYLYWLETVGIGSWAPAWPAARTRLVFLMVSIPTWGAAMAAWTITSVFLRNLWFRRGRGINADYEAINLDPAQTPARGPAMRRGYHRWPWTLLVYVSLAFCGIYLLSTYEQPNDIRYRPAIQSALASPRPQGHGKGEKVYIGAMFHDNERVLPYWTEEITKLIIYLGTDNVFVSIVESGSGDSSPRLLEQFEKKLNRLNVKNRVIVRDTSIPRPPSMETATPRIQFLADVRNKVMEPLVHHGGYDRAIFSNDIFIEADTILELLATKDGNYDMACGTDLSYWGLYDAWVTRDRLGRLVSSLWPYFLEDAGMQAVMADEPAPVFTCWNGIVAFRPDPFLPPRLRTSGRLSRNPLSTPLPSSHPAYGQPSSMSPAETPAMSFRASTAKECFSSESFLMPYDFRRQFEMNDIYLNPRVINSYDWAFYVWYKYILRHWLVKWWIENVEKGKSMHLAKMIVGDPKAVWRWDGGECFPW